MTTGLITGAHAVLYSRDAGRDREFLRDVLQLPSVDVGGGWLIFALPPSEVAVHPAESGDRHELYLMTDNLTAFVDAMTARGIVCGPPQSMRWGMLTTLALPGGGRLDVYEPRHARPSSPRPDA